MLNREIVELWKRCLSIFVFSLLNVERGVRLKLLVTRNSVTNKKVDIKDYIQGKRHGKEANEFERKAQNDSFLHDAIDGFDAVDGDHMRVIDDIELQFQKKINSRSKNKYSRLWTISIAASIVLLVGVGSLFLLRQSLLSVNDPVIAYSESVSEILDPDTQDILLHENADHKEILIAADQSATPLSRQSEESRAETPPPPPPSPMVSDISVLSVVEDDCTADELVISEEEYERIVFDFNETESESIAVFGDRDITDSMKESKAEANLADNKATRKIRGSIVDESGEPLIGVSVMVEGKNIGTVTDYDGKYELNVPLDEDRDLIASYIGYESKKISGAGAGAPIQLDPSSMQLDEVVVTGYGAARKKDFTGSVAKVGNNDGYFNSSSSGISVSKNDTGISDYLNKINFDKRVFTESKKDSVSQKTLSPQIKFEEKEFDIYFLENRSKDICDNKEAQVTARFYIDANGTPQDIKITKSNCEELERELIRLLKTSPKWSKREQHIRVKITL